MAHFQRTEPVPTIAGGYNQFRPFVRSDFRQCCAYCLLNEFWAGGQANFELDHFRPIKLFPQLENDYYNLYYSCHICNQAKWAYWPTPDKESRDQHLVDFCIDNLEKHYMLLENGLLEPLTGAAQYTIILLRLNSKHLVKIRSYCLSNKIRIDEEPVKE